MVGEDRRALGRVDLPDVFLQDLADLALWQLVHELNALGEHVVDDFAAQPVRGRRQHGVRHQR